MKHGTRGLLASCLLALVLSGAAGLIYQVAWTRRLASVTSATAAAQALVLAVFMAGLSLGAFGASRLGVVCIGRCWPTPRWSCAQPGWPSSPSP